MPDTAPKPARNTVEIPMQGRLATVQPGSFKSETRTVDVVWSTGAKVRRYSWYRDEYYDEELSLDPAHVDLGRLNGGAPFLNAHNAYELDAILGVVVAGSARIEKGAAVATIQFSARDDVAPIVRDVEAGIIRNISVGYNVRSYVIEQIEGQVPVYRAVDWTPMELSAVPIPADAGAQFRGKPQGATAPCIIEVRASAAQPVVTEENPMTQQTQTAAAITPAVTTQPAAETRAAETIQAAAPSAAAAPAAAAPAATGNVAKEIRAAVKAARLDDSFALDLIGEGITLDAARAKIIDKLGEGAGTEIRSQISVDVPRIEKARGAIEGALLHRFDPAKYKLGDDAREFRGMTLMEIGRECMEQRGIKTRGMSKVDLAGLILGLDTRAGGLHSTSDFPIITGNIANKSLRAAYEAAPQTFRVFCKQATAADFKQVTKAQLGDAPSFEKINEGGEVKRGTIGEAKEVYSLLTYGKAIGITRQAIINDDMGAFTRIPELFGRAAADLESDTVWAIITTNGNMGDGVALFHASHANLGTGAAITVASLGDGRAAMRKQKGLGGRLLNLQPKFLILPAALETLGQQYITATNIITTKAADQNPFAGVLTPVVEPRLDVTSASNWYLSADPAQIDTIEFAYLEGGEGVQTASRIGFDVDGIELKFTLDFAAKAIDWRGMWKNPN